MQNNTTRAVLKPKTAKVPASAQEYAAEIEAHADLPISESLYAGPNFVPLKKFLKGPAPENGSEGEFVCLHDLTLPDDDKARTEYFPSPDHFVRACDDKLSQPSPSLVLFMRGYPSPNWVTAIGWKCNVDPEFFLRHMEFRFTDNEKNYYSLPGLPSSTSNIVRLRLPSIGVSTQDHGHRQSQAEIENFRKDSAKRLEEYTSNLARGSKVKLGDSVVRSFAVHDQKHYSLEQDVSVCVNKFGRGWMSIIWLDSGNDLLSSHDGPWSSTLYRSRSWMTSLSPIVPHKVNISLKTSHINPWKPGITPNGHRLHQSSSLLHKFYGRLLNQEIIAKDAFYALSELFTFAATAESQFLNMLEAKVTSAIDRTVEIDENDLSISATHSSTITNLLYSKKLLDEHVRRLSENLSTIQNRGGNKWPKAKEERHKLKIEVVAEDLLIDFEYLLEKAKRLSGDCDRGMNIAGNNATISESRRAFQNQRWVTKLTLLAFLYIPATFTTSVFGMNFVEFGQGNKHIWLWVALLPPVYAISLCVLYVDMARIRQWLDLVRNDDGE